jgi:hypothetical protein
MATELVHSAMPENEADTWQKYTRFGKTSVIHGGFALQVSLKLLAKWHSRLTAAYGGGSCQTKQH